MQLFFWATFDWAATPFFVVVVILPPLLVTGLLMKRFGSGTPRP